LTCSYSNLAFFSLALALVVESGVRLGIRSAAGAGSDPGGEDV
jgi:hypothetical protein